MMTEVTESEDPGFLFSPTNTNQCPLCRVISSRMIKSQEQDEFIAVRVQDPRVQNDGSWNSYVDFKIFLHTNSKAFTAKTSCVRRRYSEFVWLRKKIQKNAGLVPVPDLPKKSLFSFINDDFIERRRKGLQSFLDKVLHMTVCLSDSQLHLFIQTQLPVKHIEDCVQGHTPYTVTEAILTYASSNRGWVQEEEGGAQEIWTAPVPYESVESPAPHLPSLKCGGATTSSGPEPPNEHADVSDLESRLSDTEQTPPDLKQGNDHGQMVQKEESSIIMVEVHPDISYLSSLATEQEGDIDGTEKTQKPNEKVKDLQEDKSDGPVPQIDGPIEVKPLQDLYGLDKAVFDGTNEGEKQEHTVRQTPPDNDVSEEDPVAQVHYNEVTLDLSAAQEDDDEQSDHIEKDLLETTDEPVALHDGASSSEKNLLDTEDQEQGKAEITEEDAIQENEVSDEDLRIETAIVDETSPSEISETCLSCSQCSEDHIDEVNKINAKSVHTSSAILILEVSEEALGTQTAPMTENEQNISPEIPNEDSNLNADTSDEAIEVDSNQC